MNGFLKQAANPGWWISVVVVGLLINLASDYLKPAIDKFVERFSAARKQANEKQKLSFKEDVQELLNEPSKVADLQLDVLYFNLRAVLWTVISLIINSVFSILFPLDIAFAVFPFIQALSNMGKERYCRSVLREYRKLEQLNR